MSERDGRIEEWSDSKSDQFKANMAVQEGSPFSIFCKTVKEDNVVLIVQNHGVNYIVLPDPESMRKLAEIFKITADKWESGELGLDPKGMADE